MQRHPKPFRRISGNRRGFTLAELIASLVGISLLGLAVGHMTIFLSKSYTITAARLNAITTAQHLDRQIETAATEAQAVFLYSNYGSKGYDLASVARDNVNALWQPSIHQRAGGRGNYVVFVKLHDERTYLTGGALRNALADDIPPPVERITGFYVGGAYTATGQIKSGFQPIRRFELSFTPSAGAIGGTSGQVLEDLLPTDSDAPSHETVGWVRGATVDTFSLFRLASLDTIVIDIPISLRDSEQAAVFRFQKTLVVTNQ